jgi:O-antigen ligase
MSKSRRSRSRRRAPKVPLTLAGSALWLGDGVTISLFCLLLLCSPLPMGGNREWAWAPMTVVIGLVAVLVAFGLGARRGPVIAPRENVPLATLIICFVLMMGVALFQMLPLASAPSAVFYATAASVLGHARAAVPTLAIDTSIHTLLKCLACGLVFVISRTICAEPARARLLLFVLVASAILVMIYALLELPVNSCFVGNYIKKQGEYVSGYRCTMSGTFVNSNSFGCFMGMAVAAAIGLVFTEQKSRRPEALEAGDRVASAITGTRLALVAIALLLTGGLLISAARAAFAAFALSMLLFALILMRGRWRSRRQMIGVLIGGIVSGIAMLLLAGSTFLRKVGTLAQAGNFDRLIIWKAAIQEIDKSPWLGWGLGSFADIYTVMQPIQVPMANDKAHSTPLETFVELGIPGGLLACFVVLIPWIVIWRGATRLRQHRNLPAAALAASSVAIFHSFVDFSLQMPAIGFFVSALLGMGWAQVFGTRGQASYPFTEPTE